MASNKTHLSNFSRDKLAWPVYLTIRNISKSICQKLSEKATVLIGYIPVSKLECFSKSQCQYQSYQVFHNCMCLLFEQLIKAGQEGVKMICADGLVHKVYPILCTYVADHPKQCLVACNNENQCSQYETGAKKLGLPLDSVLQSSEKTLDTMTSAKEGDDEEFVWLRLCSNNPFWQDLSHCDISSCFMPDLLH